ncbi:MAG: hypothetical protein WC992_06330 [Acholeplasmataceae bacterium]|jgi:hypothetical protein
MKELTPGTRRAVAALFPITDGYRRLHDTPWGRKTIEGLGAVIEECTAAAEMLHCLTVVNEGLEISPEDLEALADDEIVHVQMTASEFRAVEKAIAKAVRQQ